MRVVESEGRKDGGEDSSVGMQDGPIYFITFNSHACSTCYVPGNVLNVSQI